MSTNAIAGGWRIYIGDGVASPNQSFVPISELKEVGNVFSPDPQYSDASTFETPEIGQDWKYLGSNMKTLTFKVNLIPDDGTHDEITGLIFGLLGGFVWDYRIKVPGQAQKWIKITGTINSIENTTQSRRALLEADFVLQPHSWEVVESADIPQ